jgi:hypothetical protein
MGNTKKDGVLRNVPVSGRKKPAKNSGRKNA